jgi:hypothetical protein
MISQKQIALVRQITAKFHPTLIGVFGSYARNEQVEGSDLDILIDFSEQINLLDLIGLEEELSAALQLDVDLVTVASVNPLLEKYILGDVIRIEA